MKHGDHTWKGIIISIVLAFLPNDLIAGGELLSKFIYESNDYLRNYSSLSTLERNELRNKLLKIVLPDKGPLTETNPDYRKMLEFLNAWRPLRPEAVDALTIDLAGRFDQALADPDKENYLPVDSGTNVKIASGVVVSFGAPYYAEKVALLRFRPRSPWVTLSLTAATIGSAFLTYWYVDYALWEQRERFPVVHPLGVIGPGRTTPEAELRKMAKDAAIPSLAAGAGVLALRYVKQGPWPFLIGTAVAGGTYAFYEWLNEDEEYLLTREDLQEQIHTLEHLDLTENPNAAKVHLNYVARLSENYLAVLRKPLDAMMLDLEIRMLNDQHALLSPLINEEWALCSGDNAAYPDVWSTLRLIDTPIDYRHDLIQTPQFEKLVKPYDSIVSYDTDDLFTMPYERWIQDPTNHDNHLLAVSGRSHPTQEARALPWQVKQKYDLEHPLLRNAFVRTFNRRWPEHQSYTTLTTADLRSRSYANDPFRNIDCPKEVTPAQRVALGATAENLRLNYSRRWLEEIAQSFKPTFYKLYDEHIHARRPNRKHVWPHEMNALRFDHHLNRFRSGHVSDNAYAFTLEEIAFWKDALSQVEGEDGFDDVVTTVEDRIGYLEKRLEELKVMLQTPSIKERALYAMLKKTKKTGSGLQTASHSKRQN